MKINFVDIKSQNAPVCDELVTGLKDMIVRGAFVGGKEVDIFEHNLAAFCGTGCALGCSDGTSAIKLALLGAGIQKGQKVIVPVNSFIASANGIVHAGGIPVFVDCDPDTFLLDLNQVEEQLKNNDISFILPVHLYGNPCPMQELQEMAEKYGAQIIEDNAQAIGAEYQGKKTGVLGLAGAISFYPAKNLGSFGQGGAIVTSCKKLADYAQMYAEQGVMRGEDRYTHQVIGYNDRLHAIQAYVLDVMLKRIDNWNAQRIKVAQMYHNKLPLNRVQKVTVEAKHVYHLFEFKCDSEVQRKYLADNLKNNEIPFGFHYPIPIHKQKAYSDANGLSFPKAEQLAKQLISLPMHPFLTEEQVDFICDVINKSVS